MTKQKYKKFVIVSYGQKDINHLVIIPDNVDCPVQDYTAISFLRMPQQIVWINNKYIKTIRQGERL